MDFKNENKIKAMLDLLREFKMAPYPPSIAMRILTILERDGIVYLLDTLPEGESYKFYCDKLDQFVVDVIKKEKK